MASESDSAAMIVVSGNEDVSSSGAMVTTKEEGMAKDGSVGSTGVVAKSQTAYMFFSKAMHSVVRGEFIAQGRDLGISSITSEISIRWRELADKTPWEQEAYTDKQRFLRETAIRDAEVLRAQEERRQRNGLNAEVVTTSGSRPRARVSYERGFDDDAEDTPEEEGDYDDEEEEKPKKKRAYKPKSEEAKNQREARKQQKKQEKNSMSSASSELKVTKVQQAEARLKYLLSQSDIFAHFGKGAKTPGTSSSYASASASSSSSSSSSSQSKRGPGRGRRAGGGGDMDEDEKALVESVGGDDDEADGEGKSATQGEAAPTGIILRQQPSIITGGTMRPYQLAGLNWVIRLIENGINGILADEMGLGKTLQSISVVAFLKQYYNMPGPHLVIVPKSTLSNWQNEFTNWCPSIRVLRFHGSREEREEIVLNSIRPGDHESRDWDVCLTTYEVVNLEKMALSKLSWKFLIIDEAHRLKNEASQFAKTVRLLSTRHRLLLTGTPLQNNLHELWALLNFLLPDVFDSAEEFDEWFNLDVDDTESKQRIISQLHKLLRPFMLRRLKVEVEKSLPPKSETILFTGMSEVQKNLYKQLLLRDIETINGNAASGGGGRTAILNIVMQLRKCCNHPYLFPGVEDRALPELGDHLYTNCGKMMLLHKLLAKMKERDHRVLIFSQMTRMLDILEDYLRSQMFTYCRIDGNTSYEDREDRIQEFNRPGSETFVFLLSTRAGGLGINLQTADTVILYDSDWNPQADLQAQDRAHRIGQKKPVQVFRLVTDESVEVKVVERAQQKLKLDAMVVQQGRLQEKERKMSKQDLLDTLRFGADKIFRSKESDITDADIDLILEEGRKRTVEMNEKLSVAEKGDMYDFRLDGGMKTQEYYGIDYSEKSTREAEILALNALAYAETGRRGKYHYGESGEILDDDGMLFTDSAPSVKKPKLPRHLRLPRMDEWQFYDHIRLEELQKLETKYFDELVERGEAPQPGNIAKLVVLPADLYDEKNKLLNAGFKDWTKVHHNSFLRGATKFGRHAIEKIVKEIGSSKTLEEVKRYSDAFWSKGKDAFSEEDWKKKVKDIERGENKLAEITKLSRDTAQFVAAFANPWEELSFHILQHKSSISAEEDRYLLCLSHMYGHGAWGQIKSAIRRCEKFRHNYYLQTLDESALSRKCESLMKAAEKEFQYLEKMKGVVEEDQESILAEKTQAPFLKVGNYNDVKRYAHLTKDLCMNTISNFMSARESAQHQRSQNGVSSSASSSGGVGGSGSGSGSGGGGGGGGGGGASLASQGKKTSNDDAMEVDESDATAAGGGGGGGGDSKGKKVVVKGIKFEDGMLPTLCKMLERAGSTGVAGIITQFHLVHPNVAKRQIENKCNELAVKEKGEKDTTKVWKLRPSAEYLLTKEDTVQTSGGVPLSTVLAAASTTKLAPVSGSGGGEKRKRENGSGASPDPTKKTAVSSSSNKKESEGGTRSDAP